MKLRHISLILACCSMQSCDPHLPSGTDLFVDFEIIEAPTSQLSDSVKPFMDGIYEVVRGREVFGNPVVGRWVGSRWCLFSQHEVIFAESAGGSSGNSTGDSIKLRGYVRYVRSGSGTRLRLKILRDEGAAEIIAGSAPLSVRIRGKTEDGHEIELLRSRAITAPPFNIVAHRGGGRNSDRLGFSENSLEMIRHASALGATGIEIDIKRTRDGKLIVFHDDTFSPRTVQGTYLLGDVGNYDLEHIRSLGRLINGESIPTLSEALRTVIEETDLSLVWLDVKDPAAVSAIVQVQREMKILAALRMPPRSVSVLLGMPSQNILDAYNAVPIKDSTEVLIEFDLETALSTPQCLVWAPIWTRNISPEDVARLHNSGKLVISWTVDLREVITDHLNRVDGILSNYPTLVAGIHESKE